MTPLTTNAPRRPSRKRLDVFRLLLLALVWLLAIPQAGAAPVNIAAASSLKFALEEIAAQFEAGGGGAIRLVFGSSGNLYRQIRQGAPFELFLSADERYPQRLREAGRSDGAGVRYAEGRLVLYAPAGSPLVPDPQLAGLRQALADGRLKRLAIANPEHAPYGRAAAEALRTAGLWEAVRGRLILGENVAQAAQFATSGSTHGGIFAYSLALTPGVVKPGGRYQRLPRTLHKPLHQRMVLVKGAGQTARRFYLYLQQPEAREVLARHGFAPPGEP